MLVTIRPTPGAINEATEIVQCMCLMCNLVTDGYLSVQRDRCLLRSLDIFALSHQQLPFIWTAVRNT